MTLEKLPLGQMAQILEVQHSHPSSIRLSELGLVAGQMVQIRKKAPLGDPLEIKIMNYSLCLRKTEASCILVKPIITANLNSHKK